MKLYNCIQCGQSCVWLHSKTNKFCSNQCQSVWKWENITKPRIKAGQCTHHAYICLKKYISERDGECCALCKLLPVWNNRPLVLQLDHIDGNSDNYFPSNLRLLCPNCHTQTATFGSKGQGNRYHKGTIRNEYIREYRQ